MKQKLIYLDYAATTPVDPAVVKAMEPYFSDVFGNASSVHSFGQKAVKAVDEARVTIARFLNCQPMEVVFTSGATESNNCAIKGVVFQYLLNSNTKARNSKQIQNSNKINLKLKLLEHLDFDNLKIVSDFDIRNSDFPHIITTAIEHPSVLESCRALQEMGLAEVTYIKPQSNGIVTVEDVIGAIKENTVLVSVMYANNEVGTIQPIRAIARELRELKEKRGLREDGAYPLFHTDATQAVQFLSCRVDKLGVDLLSMSAHKIYGPKGVGVLYVKKGTPIRRFFDGGAQEFDLRAGTLNTPAMVGFGKAIELFCGLNSSHSEPILAASSVAAGSARSTDLLPAIGGETMPDRSARTSSLGSNLAQLRDKFIEKILNLIPNTSLNGDPINRLPNNINIRFNGVDGQTLVMAVDQAGIAVSAGSACATGAPEPSHVITAMLGEQAAKESIRFTIGRYTKSAEMNQAIKALRRIVSRMRLK